MSLYVEFPLDLHLGDASGLSEFKLSSSPLGSKGSRHGDAQRYDCRRDAHRGTVRGGGLAVDGGDHAVLSDGIDDLRRRRRDHVAQLVRDAGERGAVRGRREFVEVDWDHAPGALDEDYHRRWLGRPWGVTEVTRERERVLTLHKESGGRQTAFGSGQDPSGDQDSRNKGGHDDGTAPSEPLRDVADHGAADASARLHDDAGSTGRSVVHLLLREHECCVAVLAGVREVVEPSHQDDAVDAHAPLLDEHLARLDPEGSGRRVACPCFLCGDELLGLGEQEADQADPDGQAGADPEDRLPGVGASADA